MKIAVTCLQMIRDLDDWREDIANAGLEVMVPEIDGQHLEGDALVAALVGCAGVIAGDDQFTRDVLDRSPELRVISKWGIGTDGIDRAAAGDHGIEIRNTPGMFDDEVADVTMAYLVMLARDLAQIDRGVRANGWPKPAGTSLRDATLGIVGLGGIGRAVARRASVSGMSVLGVDPSEASRRLAHDAGVETVDLDELLRRSEFISVNCPLNEQTYHLLDQTAFGRVKPGVRIVNTGRGGVIQTDALVESLSSGTVRGAALDVLESEPPPPDHPLRQFDQVIFGSHNASNTLEASARTHGRALRNLIEALNEEA